MPLSKLFALRRNRLRRGERNRGGRDQRRALAELSQVDRRSKPARAHDQPGRGRRKQEETQSGAQRHAHVLSEERMVTIRAENAGDPAELSAIGSINEAAFAGREEADLVDKLRTGGDLLISLVAELDQRIVGHILFSRMWIETSTGRVAAVALAPVAVLPEQQRRGIGGQLIRHGLDVL